MFSTVGLPVPSMDYSYAPQAGRTPYGVQVRSSPSDFLYSVLRPPSWALDIYYRLFGESEDGRTRRSRRTRGGRRRGGERAFPRPPPARDQTRVSSPFSTIPTPYSVLRTTRPDGVRTTEYGVGTCITLPLTVYIPYPPVPTNRCTVGTLPYPTLPFLTARYLSNLVTLPEWPLIS